MVDGVDEKSHSVSPIGAVSKSFPPTYMRPSSSHLASSSGREQLLHLVRGGLVLRGDVIYGIRTRQLLPVHLGRAQDVDEAAQLENEKQAMSPAELLRSCGL